MPKILKILLFIILLVIIIITGIFIYKNKYPSKTRSHINFLPAGTTGDSIVVFKEQHRMVVYYRSKELKSYSISLGKNPVGQKQMEGDKKTPEGLYKISGRNPNSKFHLSLRISYPDKKDIENAKLNGYEPGGDIMIHGLPNNMSLLEDYYLNTDWTDGCIAVANEEIEELWNVIPDNTPIFINK